MKRLIVLALILAGIIGASLTSAEDLYYQTNTGERISFPAQKTYAPQNTWHRKQQEARDIESWLRRVRMKSKKTQVNQAKRAKIRSRSLQANNFRSATISAPKQTKWNIIIAPHPDDEILCCAARIRRDIKEGVRYKVVYITDGDAYGAYEFAKSKQYGQTRRQESTKAMKRLGVPKSDLIFLNFPDGNLHRLKSDTPITSAYTGQNQSVKAYQSGSVYTEGELKSLLRNIFTDYPPAQIYIPSQDDTHPDHRQSGEITTKLVAEMELDTELLEYTVHGQVAAVTLEKNNWKRRLIRIFKSQLHDDYHRNYLYQLADRVEKFVKR